MGLSHFPHGVSSFGIPLYGSGFGPPLGLGTGDIKYVVTAKASTNKYYEKLQTNGIKDSDIFTTVASAFAATTASRNDVVAVTPGAHQVTGELAWNKDFTHCIGLAGPTSFNDYSEPGVSIYTTTAGVAETVDLTGDYCQFHGINFANNGADTGNLAAFNVDGYSASFFGCSFHGVMNSTQNGVAAAAALYIDGLGSWYRFVNCVIGDDNWTVRTDANSGQLAYVGTTSCPASQHGIFEDCRFRQRSETATVAMVRIAHVYAIDRIHEFVRCSFSNFSVDWGNDLNRVFYQVGSLQTANIFIRDCIVSGFTEYQTDDQGELFQGNNALANKQGGIAVELTT